MPSAHRRYGAWTPERLQCDARAIGPATEALVIAAMARRPHPEQEFRTCLGILRLFCWLEVARVEAVSNRAVEIGALSYASVSSILKHRLDWTAPSAGPPDDAPLLHANIRNSGYYHWETDIAHTYNTLRDLADNPDGAPLGHAEWLGILLERESTLRQQKRFDSRAKNSMLRHLAAVEDVDYRTPRGLDRAMFMKLASCDWIRERRHCLLTEPSGVGKSWLACAPGYKSCRENLSVFYQRVPRLSAAVALARGDGRYARLLKQLDRVDLLILADWGPAPLIAEQQRDLLEIVEDRYNAGSLIITSQVPIDRWHDIVGNPILADAILGCFVHNAHRIELKGESLRKQRAAA